VYDGHVTITYLDDHTWAIMGLCSIAIIFNYIWCCAALRQARKDRAYSVPVFTTMFWLVGDGTFVLRYDRWFHDYRDWYPELFWVALLFTVAFELAFTAQIIRYGRRELLPDGTQRQFTALIAGGVGLAAVAWLLVDHIVVDPLGIVYFDLANLSGPIAAGALVLRRRSRAGQRPLIWYSYAAMATPWYIAQYLWFGPEFRAAPHTIVAFVCVGCALGLGYAISRLPAYDPDAAAEVPSSAGRAAVAA
jgi:hypothetical protein